MEECVCVCVCVLLTYAHAVFLLLLASENPSLGASSRQTNTRADVFRLFLVRRPGEALPVFVMLLKSSFSSRLPSAVCCSIQIRPAWSRLPGPSCKTSVVVLPVVGRPQPLCVRFCRAARRVWLGLTAA